MRKARETQEAAQGATDAELVAASQVVQPKSAHRACSNSNATSANGAGLDQFLSHAPRSSGASPTTEVSTTKQRRDPLTGWIKNDAAASAAPGDTKTHNATNVLAAGLKKTFKAHTASEHKERPAEGEPASCEEVPPTVNAEQPPDDEPTDIEKIAQSSSVNEVTEVAAVVADVDLPESARAAKRVSFHASVEESADRKATGVEEQGSVHEKPRRSSSGRSRERKLRREQKVLDELRNSPQMAKLRQMVQKDVKALQCFLDAVTESNPELMKLIATHRDEFMEILLGKIELEPAKTVPAAPEQIEADKENVHTEKKKPSVEEKVMRNKKRFERAFEPNTDSIHPLARLHSPYSCAVCKKNTDLMLCGSCKSVRFCGREHQRKFWPRHEHVCKFLAGCRGGLLEDVSGKNFKQEGLPLIIDVWARHQGSMPAAFEFEQLCHIPRCRVCSKVPATLMCDASLSAGYCSESCKNSDDDWRSSWQCTQVRTSSYCAHALHNCGDGLPVTTGQADATIPASTFDAGWSEYVKVFEISLDNVEFLNLSPIVQHLVIDQLSYPMSVLQGLFLANKSLEQLCEGKDVLDVHLLFPTFQCHDTGALVDMFKYQEWLYRAGSQVQLLNVHIVGLDMFFPDGLEYQMHDFSAFLDAERIEQGGKFHLHRYRRPCQEWLLEDRTKPMFRVAFSACFQYEPWNPVLEALAYLGDGVPLVVTECALAELDIDLKHATRHGFKALLPPTHSNFCSPLALQDDARSNEENPTGLSVWNCAVAVFESYPRAALDATQACTMEQDVQDVVAGMVHCRLPLDVEDDDPEEPDIAQDSGDASLIFNAQAEATLPHLQGESTFSASGPFGFDGTSFHDLAHGPDNNPEGSFAVQFSVLCEPNGKGFRSPLASREDLPAGYVFYVDGDDKWVFWVGNSTTMYWSGIQGPSVHIGSWESLAGVVDIENSEIRFYVNDELVGTKTGVSFARNMQQPLRLGAGRLNSKPRFWFSGQVRNVTVRRLPTEASVDVTSPSSSSPVVGI